IKLSNTPLVIINLFLIISIFLINTQIGTLNYFNIFCSVLLLFIIIIFIFIISKLLIYAERPFPVLIGEYTILEALLLLLFALTFESVKNVDYTMFSSFLILTPTYQLIYVLIVLGGLLLLGLYLNDKKMKKKFN
ncbi:peptide ABC transporter permease, partial [Methanobrevibacter sp. OttesenSCG-928-I08]|nr:peptide ABC transporter permease [Methanobrevibacter sp. OttesenSCG-928-I08]